MNMDSSQSHHQNVRNNLLAFLHYHHHDAETTRTTTSHHGPKLEDFLGGGSGPYVCHFPDESQHDTAAVYESDLMKIADSVLGGFSTGDNQQVVEVAPTPPQQDNSPVKKAVETFGDRTSIYRGVTRHRWTGRYEAHLWDNSCRRLGRSRKGRQVYLGGYDNEYKAARAYDLAALKYWGPTTITNFPVCFYDNELEGMKKMTRQEFVASLRRKSSGSRGASIYRGVTRRHQHGRWQAKIGRVAGNKDLYLGTYSTQEAAAEAYDIAAIKFQGLSAVTNFDMSRYDVNIIANEIVPVGDMFSKTKISTDPSPPDGQDLSSISEQPTHANNLLSFGLPNKQNPSTDYWDSVIGYNQNYQCTTPYSMEYPSSITTNHGYYNIGGGLIRQENSNGGTIALSTTSTIPMGTPIGLNGSSYGNWVEQSFHSYQPANQNLSVIQTPFFGIE